MGTKIKVIILSGILLLVFMIFRAPIISASRRPDVGLFHRNNPKYHVIAYIAGWRSDWSAKEIDAKELTEINYAFANVKNGKVVLGYPNDPRNFQIMDSLKMRNPNLKILVTVGGWLWSKNFSNVALTQNSRDRFANSAVAFIRKYHLDGVDIDWEFPAQIGAGNIYRPADTRNFTLLLKDLREKLNQASYQDHRTGSDKYMLTIAAGADKKYVKHTQLGKLQKYLNYINLMTYDYYNGTDDTTGHLTNLYQSRYDHYNKKSVARSVRLIEKQGVTANKIVIGAAFYGRSWAGVRSQNHGLYQPASGHKSAMPYDSLAEWYINKNGFRRYWDSSAKAPYLWNAEKKIFISYDGPESIRYKAKYVKRKHLGGIMFWEYSQDKKGILLNDIYRDLNR